MLGANGDDGLRLTQMAQQEVLIIIWREKTHMWQNANSVHLVGKYSGVNFIILATFLYIHVFK